MNVNDKPRARFSIEVWGPTWTVRGNGIVTYSNTLEGAYKYWSFKNARISRDVLCLG